ncbi:hypothetical protein BJV78DRAFT_537291 [Lactifluus subvellereus]|nr:hypothetical protein BJV78DRAFT_537291 [Lactifluus subvellereus]
MSTLHTSTPLSLHHFLAIILIVAPLGAVLVPIIGVLIFFTPSESRRRPVFVLNVLACLLGICQSIFFTSLNASVILHPDKPISHTTLLAAVAILLTPPILVNSILLFRLLAFYPIQLTPRLTLIAVLAPTCICKVARLACLIAFLVTYPVSRSNAPAYATLPGLVWGRGPWILSLVALQALDNSYVSSMFLYKLYRFGYTTQKAVGGSRSKHLAVIVRVPPSSRRPRSRGHLLSCTCRFYHCTRELCRSVCAHPPICSWASLDISSFIRVTVDIAVIVLMIVLPDWTSGTYIIFIANFITILGIVFATVWTTNQNWILRRMVEAGIDARTQSTMHFQTKSTTDAFSVFDPYDTPSFMFPT